MRRLLANRVHKLEAIGRPAVRVPHVLHVVRGETTAVAMSRFAAPNSIPRGHRLLVVPARDRTADDEADFDVKFHAHQTNLIAEAKSETMKVTDQ